MTNVSDSSPRIYVACLAAYNNGFLHGAWIDADQDADQIRVEIAAMLARSPVILPVVKGMRR
ncbi:antirestriction protein ArdA [Brevundimonas naejangsanensis]|uniref:antirestriction protein ArdA n=1 Tax=Brevundimonas naejangsanensis TaxID=588932 RepID=UPI0004624F15|nr:antirestriction protein ArdA [Brevundimonas naejangsanensis]